MVYIIIVLYRPDEGQLRDLLSSTSERCRYVIIDNSESPTIDVGSAENIILIRNYSNLGIAKAQNIGIDYAMSNNAKVIGFFDQDSFPVADCVEQLIAAVTSRGVDVVVPCVFDRQSENCLPIYALTPAGRVTKYSPDKESAPGNRNFVISSGMFVTSELLRKTGSFSSDLFIDHVDYEFCSRIHQHDVPVHILQNAKLLHTIGERRQIWRLGKIACRTPVRTYYFLRNSLFLSLRDSSSRPIFIHQFSVGVFVTIWELVLCEHRWRRLIFAVTAVAHGVTGKLGPRQ